MSDRNDPDYNAECAKCNASLSRDDGCEWPENGELMCWECQHAEIEQLQREVTVYRQNACTTSPIFERLVAFLYLTMLNDLPIGRIRDTVNAVTENTEVDFQLANPHLEALARDYATRIYEG